MPAEPPDVDVPPPGWLDAEALHFWHTTAPSLIATGRLRAAMSQAFGVLCQIAVDCERLSREVAAEGTVLTSPRGLKPNPKARLLRDARRDFLQYSKAFGLDAASNSRLPTSTVSEQVADPFETFVKSRG